MKKVCMLTSHHSPLDARLFHKEALTLHKYAFDVSIVAPVSERGFFKDAADREILKTNNELSLVYSEIKFRGFKIKKSSIPKLCFFINMKRAINAITQVGLKENADVYHCHEFDALVAGVNIKKTLSAMGKKVYVIYDVHEYWPGVYQQRFEKLPLIGSLVKTWISNLEHKMTKWCDFIITANQIVRSYFLLRNRFAKMEVIYNCPTLELFKDIIIKHRDDYMILCHEGTLNFDRGLKTMVKVIKKLNENDRKVKLLIVGDVFGEENKWLEESSAKDGLQNSIEKTGWLPYEKVGENVARGDIGIIFMKPIMNNMLAGPPNKLFNYMRYGLPVIAPDFPEMRRIILENTCGLLVDTSNVESICAAIKHLLDNPRESRRMGKNGREAVLKRYNWGEMEKKLINVYREVLQEK